MGCIQSKTTHLPSANDTPPLPDTEKQVSGLISPLFVNIVVSGYGFCFSWACLIFTGFVDFVPIDSA